MASLYGCGTSNICRTKEDEVEEVRLREELKHIDAAIKKNKKVNWLVFLLKI